MTRSPETLFRTFLRNGDAAALAGAFDATAPELLRVAAFLLPTDEVEDAVHDAFVVAMTRGETWDEARPLLPWLLGILANEARGRLRRRRTQPPAVTPPTREPDPVAAAAAREFEAQFASALDALGRDDGALLRLHLCDELSCREIGERLQRPAGTVRTQVSRAMSQLRRRLPLSIPGVASMPAVPATSLPDLRRRLLARPEVRSAPTMPRNAAPAAARLSWPRAAVAVLVLGGALAGLFWGSGTGGPDQQNTVAAAPPLEPPTVEPSTPTAVGAGSTERRAASLATPPAAARPSWLLHGRVHDEQDRAIAGALVLLRHGEFRPEITRTESAADGTFALDLSYWRDRPKLDRQRGFFVKVHARGHNSFPHFGRFPDDADPTQPLDLSVDVDLSPYATVSGRVTDCQGRPVPAVMSADLGPASVGFEHAGDDGHFIMVIAGEQSGTLDVSAQHGHGARARLQVPVQPGRDTEVGTIVLPQGHPVGGEVVLADGTPLADWPVSVYCDEPRAFATVLTDEQGRFLFARPAECAWQIRVGEVTALGGAGEAGVRELPATAVFERVVLPGVALDLQWQDDAGAALQPQSASIAVADAGGNEVATDHQEKTSCIVVPADARVRIRAGMPGGYLVDETVTAPPAGRTDVVLAFHAAPRARFRLSVVWDDGEPVAKFECRAVGTEASNQVWAEVTAQTAGACELLAPVGPIQVVASAYDSWLDGGQVEVDAEVPADGGGTLRVVLPRLGRVGLTFRDAAKETEIRDDLSAHVTVDTNEISHFQWTDGDMEMTSSEPCLGRAMETLDLFPPGRHVVHVQVDGYEETSVEVDVRADEVARIVVWLQRS